MAFDGIVCKKVTDELQNIVGFKIDKIFEPDKNTVVLGLYGNSTSLALLTCISSNNYRINLTTHSVKNPSVAPNFCMLLRKHILGYKIKNIYMNDFERIVFIDLENLEIPDKPIYKTLIIELMGKHSNIILTDNNRVIIDSIRHTSTEENSLRDIYPTCRYQLPVSSEFNLIEKSPNAPFIDSNNLTIKYTDYKNGLPKDYVLTNFTEEFSPYTLNFAIDDFYYAKESNELFINYRNSLLNLILATLKKYEKRLSNIDNKLSECSDMDKFRLYGELITANLYKYTGSYNTGLSSIDIENYYNNNEIINIPLDKKFSLSNNAKRYYKKYSKLKNALEIVGKQKQETINDIKYIESIVYEIEACSTTEDLQEIYSEISENEIFQSSKKFAPNNKKAKNLKNTKLKNLTSNKYAKFNPLKYNIDEYTIYVGRNNKENDYLTNKFAKKSDIWFHTKDIHGSHVILKTNPGEPIIPDNILYEAAKLAALHSKAKNSSNIPVDYCEVRFVKKIPGNKPGLVTYTNNITIWVNG